MSRIKYAIASVAFALMVLPILYVTIGAAFVTVTRPLAEWMWERLDDICEWGGL